jgi:hypothetical protein
MNVTESDLCEWEEEGKQLELLCCSECGFIAERIVNHHCHDFGCDWWHIKVKMIRAKEGGEK